jgi:protease-4
MTKINSVVDSPDSQALLNQIVIDYMREKKRKRVWQWVKRIVISLVVLWGLYEIASVRMDDATVRTKPHVGLIDVKGAIFDDKAADADSFIKGMDKAYENKALKAVIVRIDSPGGSPVQADYMFNTIHYYREKYPDIKIYAVCVDICASAAYYVAAAADEIYANPSSLVGSIGVLYNGFGFVDIMHKVGVTRRLITAGSKKGFLDQFSPVNVAEEKTLQTMLDIVHLQFIAKVKAGRGKRLHIDEDTFSGLFWTGLQAKERGLIDGFASSGQLARETIKVDRIVDYTYQQSMMERVSKNIGTAMADQLPMALGMKPGLQ